MRTKIQGGYFQDEPFHGYFTDENVWVPSVTQILKLCGLSDYTGIDEDVLNHAAERGTQVHELAAVHNQHGEVDPSWISEECQPYFDAYLRFLGESGFHPDPAWTERPMIATLAGRKYGVTPDIFGNLKRDKLLIEFKCASSIQSCWSIQLAAQEAAIFQTGRIGRVRRHVLQLRKDGSYKLLPEYTDHDRDLNLFIEALDLVWWRIEAGQKLHERLGSNGE